jgi:hypothetical protein
MMTQAGLPIVSYMRQVCLPVEKAMQKRTSSTTAFDEPLKQRNPWVTMKA